MKKLILTFIAVVGLSFASSAQCGSQATLLNTDCGSYCVSMVVPLTGNLGADIANGNATNGTYRRKPTVNELMAIADELC